MKTEFFPAFLKINYPEFEIENEDAIQIGNEFFKYLFEKFNGDESKLETICDIEPLKAILNREHPFKVNGYDPALVYHFSEFVKLNTNVN